MWGKNDSILKHEGIKPQIVAQIGSFILNVITPKIVSFGMSTPIFGYKMERLTI